MYAFRYSQRVQVVMLKEKFAFYKRFRKTTEVFSGWFDGDKK